MGLDGSRSGLGVTQLASLTLDQNLGQNPIQIIANFSIGEMKHIVSMLFQSRIPRLVPLNFMGVTIDFNR